MLKICASAVIAAIMLLVLKGLCAHSAVPFSASVCVVVCSLSIILLTPVVEYFIGLSENGEYGQYISLMLKAAGIASVCSVCSGICRDLEEPSLADAVITAGKCELMLLALPLIKSVIEQTQKLLG